MYFLPAKRWPSHSSRVSFSPHFDPVMPVHRTQEDLSVYRFIIKNAHEQTDKNTGRSEGPVAGTSPSPSPGSEVSRSRGTWMPISPKFSVITSQLGILAEASSRRWGPPLSQPLAPLLLRQWGCSWSFKLL